MGTNVNATVQEVMVTTDLRNGRSDRLTKNLLLKTGANVAPEEAVEVSNETAAEMVYEIQPHHEV